MFPLSHMLNSFVRVGTLKVVDAKGRVHVFAGAPGPKVTMKLTDPTLYRRLFLNPELHAGEAYMDGRMRFPDSSLRDFLTLFSVNRLSLGNQSCANGAAADVAGLEALPAGQSDRQGTAERRSPLRSRQ